MAGSPREVRVEQQFCRRLLKFSGKLPAAVDGGLEIEHLVKRERKGVWESAFWSKQQIFL